MLIVPSIGAEFVAADDVRFDSLSVIVSLLVRKFAPRINTDKNVGDVRTGEQEWGGWQSRNIEALNAADVVWVVNLYTADVIEVAPAGVKLGQAAIKECVDETQKESLKQIKIPVAKCIIAGSMRSWGLARRIPAEFSC